MTTCQLTTSVAAYCAVDREFDAKNIIQNRYLQTFFTTGATCEARAAYPSEAPEYTSPVFNVVRVV
jgi:hypothetical protein